jgi:hypothetical protein
MANKKETIQLSHGSMIIRYSRFLTSPDEFDPGSAGQYLDEVGRQAAEALVEPVWYVLEDDGGGVVTGGSGNGTYRTTRVGFNQENQTELYVSGKVKDDRVLREH